MVLYINNVVNLYYVIWKAWAIHATNLIYGIVDHINLGNVSFALDSADC